MTENIQLDRWSNWLQITKKEDSHISPDSLVVTMRGTPGMTEKKQAPSDKSPIVYHCQKCDARGYEAEVLDEVALELGHKVCWECGSDTIEEQHEK